MAFEFSSMLEMLVSLYHSPMVFESDQAPNILDYMCNAIGNLEWMEKLDQPFKKEFAQAGLVPWTTLNTGKIAGKVKAAGGGGFTAGNFTYIVIHEAG